MNRCITALSLLLLLFGSRSARAQFTTLTVSGSPATMTVNAATAGSAPTAAVNAATTYFVKAKNPAGAQKITASINAPMPTGTTLALTLGTPPSAVSMGTVNLDTTTRDIMISIDHENGSTYGITYTFTATIAAGVVPAQSRTVTLTLTSYP